MSAQNYRIQLYSGRKVMLTGVTATPTKADIPYYDGSNNRDIYVATNGIGSLSIPTGNILAVMKEGNPTTTLVSNASDAQSYSDDINHTPPRNVQSQMTVYQFTLTSGLVMEIPFANVEAMYTDEAT